MVLLGPSHRSHPCPLAEHPLCADPVHIRHLPASGALSLIKVVSWTANSMQVEIGLIYSGVPNSRTVTETTGTQ